MTEPIELLHSRLTEIKEAKDRAIEHKLPLKERAEISAIYNRYYVCIQELKKHIRTI
jgi:hypothetical protein|tara:strand:+ start:124 stop:294 length:171 start_codon:yes stop_codon:yes gene_type:complete